MIKNSFVNKATIVSVMLDTLDTLLSMKTAAIDAGKEHEQFGADTDKANRLGAIYNACTIMLGAELLFALHIAEADEDTPEEEIRAALKELRKGLEEDHVPQDAIDAISRLGIDFTRIAA